MGMCSNLPFESHIKIMDIVALAGRPLPDGFQFGRDFVEVQTDDYLKMMNGNRIVEIARCLS